MKARSRCLTVVKAHRPQRVARGERYRVPYRHRHRRPAVPAVRGGALKGGWCELADRARRNGLLDHPSGVKLSATYLKVEMKAF